MVLGFNFSSVDELESFVVFEKIWGIRSSGPKILLKHVLEPLIYRQSWLKLLEGKQNNLNNLSKLLFVAFKGQYLYAISVQEWGSVSRLLCSSFGQCTMPELGSKHL